MPTIGIYVPSIGIKSGVFGPVLGPVDGSGESGPGTADMPFFRIGDKGLCQPAFGGALTAFKTVFRVVEWVGEGARVGCGWRAPGGTLCARGASWGIAGWVVMRVA
jgi:hypothetical protein